uniref:Uncharacterized protein n=1 Tax=Trypanosoma congolense (strain IL3000) TaxID=1068625 RepID=G0ULE7_TRYCI|nr:hypothetical protein, unlikely [Trypanosoma congolense IL3000]
MRHRCPLLVHRRCEAHLFIRGDLLCCPSPEQATAFVMKWSSCSGTDGGGTGLMHWHAYTIPKPPPPPQYAFLSVGVSGFNKTGANTHNNAYQKKHAHENTSKSARADG